MKLSSNDCHDALNGERNAITANGIDSFSYSEHSLTEKLTTIRHQTKGENLPNISPEIPKYQNRPAQNSSNLKTIHILFIALIQNFIFIISDILQIDNESLYLGNIFLPLIAYDIYYLFQYKDIPKPNILNLLLGNYLNTNATKYLKVSMCIFQIMQDMMIYFFSFIVIYNLQIVLKIFTNLF